ncbi:Ribosomal protein L3 [Spironucleus salmonicida]|uniref:Ribosomal protein L3 n=1 Tax=Spironucleus salmonicida TaxID=348837 RepID=V6LM36_9EUKA|nr:Ribosomal protein L3 [Spironucleus salmonicida]|eukprot:EST45710.1 Ribosomal protein L3 [Spironucleus salmonicida]
MAHRNYSKCRKGNLGFLPKKRCGKSRGSIRSFPTDDSKVAPHLTAFAGYKAGSTHVLRLIEHRGSCLHNKQIVDQATVIDTPPMIGCGIVGYVRTASGIRPLTTVYATHLAASMKRRICARGGKRENGAFSQYATKATQNDFMATQLKRMKEECCIIRILAHTQPDLTPIISRRAVVMEIQVNGGDIAKKVDFAASLLEKEIPVASIFAKQDQIDTISITKGRGFEGVITRWGVTRLPRKTRRGNRKVACIGSWHPANVQWTVARAGQMGYFHRTETNKQIFLVDSATNAKCLRTEFDTTDKCINPMGGWVNYGLIKGDFVMIRGSCPGAKKRAVLLRKALLPRRNTMSVNIQWYCTASKFGHGIFETAAEKTAFYAKKVETK